MPVYKKQKKKKRFFQHKTCRFCENKIKHIDYKDVQTLRSLTTDLGKIIPKRISGNCAKHQRMLTKAIKRSRNIALIPFSAER